MVWNIKVAVVDHVPRPIIAVAREFPDGYTIAPHKHRRGQLITGASGMLALTTPQGTSVMPPQHGMWIPSDVTHNVRTIGVVNIRSLFFEPERASEMPPHCTVLNVSLFMRHLIAKAIDLPVEYGFDGYSGAVMTLIDYELHQLPRLEVSLPSPANEKLAMLCREFLGQPSVHTTIAYWSNRLGMSQRTFTRLFRRETGLSFMAWRQRACLVVALHRLTQGQTVISVAMDLGYENPAAFTAMFNRIVGVSPSTYLSQQR